MMSILIRKAKDTDAEAIAQLKNSQIEESQGVTQHRLEKMRVNQAVYLVAEKQNIIVGHVFLKFTGKPTAPNYPDVEDLFVHPDYRRLEIATLLMQQCEELVVESGFDRIGLAVTIEEEAPARKLYAKLCYTATGQDAYVDGIYDGVEDWVIDMVKDLVSD